MPGPEDLWTVTSKCASDASSTTRGATYGMAENGQHGLLETLRAADDRRVVFLDAPASSRFKADQVVVALTFERTVSCTSPASAPDSIHVSTF